MAHLRMQVSVGNSGNPLSKDHIVNVFYLGTAAGLPGPDAQPLVNDAAELWATYRPYPNTINFVTVKAYDMADEKPRPIKAQATHAVSGVGVPGPREVALCLSYFAGRNIPRRRGRMFTGPFRQPQLEETPAESEMSSLRTLAEGISGLGGINIQWVQHSQVDGSYNTVTDFWVDNEWDTMRSRGGKATVRRTGTVSG